ncbi:MAG: hypothetical protein M3198_06450 [Actinomycetota bacterium]|nr:hypothetical protein [Actinomycetota bacterium]
MNESALWLAFILGLALTIYTTSSVIRSLVVPRGLTSFVAGKVSLINRKVFLFISNRFDTYETKDNIIALQGPVFLILLLTTWLSLFLLGYTLMLMRISNEGFEEALLEAGSSMFTLGFETSRSTGAGIIAFIAAATGLIVVALLIAYLPTLYAAFNRRETLVTMLQSRAGAPAWGPEILARHQQVGLMGELPGLYTEWERWAADVAESHTNYPVLIFFRSPHPLRSWIIALLAVMDAAALQLSLSPNSAPTEARLCLRMGFSCLRYIADLLRIPYDPDPLPTDPITLTFDEFEAAMERLQKVNFPMELSVAEAWPHFSGWRVNYESLAYALADLTVAPPGPWSGPRDHLPNMAIVPQRPANRDPGNPTANGRPKAERFGWHV